MTVRSKRLLKRQSKKLESFILVDTRSAAEINKKINRSLDSNDPLRSFLWGPETKQLLTVKEEKDLFIQIQACLALNLCWKLYIFFICLLRLLCCVLWYRILWDWKKFNRDFRYSLIVNQQWLSGLSLLEWAVMSCGPWFLLGDAAGTRWSMLISVLWRIWLDSMKGRASSFRIYCRLTALPYIYMLSNKNFLLLWLINFDRLWDTSLWQTIAILNLWKLILVSYFMDILQEKQSNTWKFASWNYKQNTK